MIEIKINKAEKEMKPMIFGHFVEYMRDCITEGMWSQLLKNRGFDKRKTIPPGVVDANPHVAEHWFRTGYKNSFEISLDDKESIARDGYAQKIRCFNHYDGFVGIAQGNLRLTNKPYQGYIWIKAEESCAVDLLMKDDRNKVIYEETISADAEWKKYQFEFTPNDQIPAGVFEIRLPKTGCIWLDGASIMPKDNIGGIWPEVYEHMKGLNIPNIRFPGGCFADVYHFADGIGEIDTRPYRLNRHWGDYLDNSLGTDEFMELCRRLRCEPMLCVNFGSGTPEEAANWVEYCNGTPDTEYGRLRAQNGHEEPYHVKYWDIGNEIFGEWEVGHSNARAYAEKYLAFYRAMKAKDDSIVFMVCGGDGDDRCQDWNQTITDIIGDHMDAVCLHMYVQKMTELKPYDNKDVYYATAGAVTKYEEILTESYRTVNSGNTHKQKLLAVTEYNLGTLIDSYREQTLEAAIFNAGMLNMFMRNSEKLLMCNYSDLVNGWPGGCIVSIDGRAFGTASYYVLKMYAESNICKVLDIQTITPVYSTTEMIGNIEPLSEVPMVDISAGIDNLGRKVLFAVNRSWDEEAALKVSAGACLLEMTELYSAKTSDMNCADEQMIFPKTRKENASSGIIRLKPHSVNRIIIC